MVTLVIESVCFTSCSDSKSTDADWSVKTMISPAGVSSSEPNLHVGNDGDIYLSWVETSEDNNTSLYYSTINNSVWSKPTEISKGVNWFVNWLHQVCTNQF